MEPDNSEAHLGFTTYHKKECWNRAVEAVEKELSFLDDTPMCALEDCSENYSNLNSSSGFHFYPMSKRNC